VTEPQWTIVPAVHVASEIDPTGAGDSASAGMVMALCAGGTMPEAAIISNLVASITVQQLATTGVARPEELPERLELWRQQVAERKTYNE
jgi:sugar/nucleoside kinase (ribokinase family)